MVLVIRYNRAISHHFACMLHGFEKIGNCGAQNPPHAPGKRADVKPVKLLAGVSVSSIFDNRRREGEGALSRPSLVGGGELPPSQIVPSV